MDRKFIAWNNAGRIPGSIDRMDCDGRIIRLGEYGQKTPYGWRIEVVPQTIQGDLVSMLRARHWFGDRSTKGAVPAVRVSKPATIVKLRDAVLFGLKPQAL